MPTRRATTLIITALLLYFFANQTQVGWLYVMSALLAGVLLASWAIHLAALRGIQGDRHVGDGAGGEIYEGDEIIVQLRLHNIRRYTAAQVVVTEQCPLAPPDSLYRSVDVFVPAIATRGSISFDYSVIVDRRGVYEFPPLKIATRVPFGLFKQRRKLPVPTRVLVYPEVRELEHLSLFDRQLDQRFMQTRTGLGSEVIGIRAYRTGDSPRHIHWRSVARTGRLISKEFVEETQQGLALVLDLFHHPYPSTTSKHTPFEWSVKLAASIGDYAWRKGYPIHLVADETALVPPPGPLSRIAMLEYLARVQPDGEHRLSRLLEGTRLQSFVAVLIPWPDPAVQAQLNTLYHQGYELLVVLLEPESFPAGGPSARALADQIAGNGIDTRLVRWSAGDGDWVLKEGK
ncbi:MAG: DUF58 domain-containing protein [Anaerolineae bacterium]|nr:DUF58 domain-containing protein [Anaerolineae bacterium]